MAWLTTPSPWSYRKLKYINNSSGFLSNYQMKFTLYRLGSVTLDTTTDVYLGGNANPDLSDVRFTDTNGTTLLNYWFESNSGGVATVWVKVPSIPTGSASTHIYIYYGNSSQTSTTSNGANTFNLFDDFLGSTLDSGKWTSRGTGTVTVSGSKVDVASTALNGYATIDSTSTFGIGYATHIYAKMQYCTGGGSEVYAGFHVSDIDTDATNFYGSLGTYLGGTPNYWAYTRKGGLTSNLDTIINSQNSNYHTFKVFRISSSSTKFQIDNNTISEITTNNPTASIPVSLGARRYLSGADLIEADWLFVRTIVSTEPVWQIANTQETYTIQLTVSSTPSGAEIYLNGGDQFKTTTDFFTLYPGTYDVLLKKVGYQDWWSGYFTIDPNDPSQQQNGYVVTGNLSPALITATNMTLDKTSCLTSCTVTATITWNNPGATTSFEPAIKVDNVRTGSGSTIALTSGQIYTTAFSLSLGIGSHSICPDPN